MYTVTIENRVEKFIRRLQKSTKSKVIRLKKLLEIHGADLGLPHSRKISPQFYELRIRGNQEVRIFYTHTDHTIILFHGFRKKTQKIPKKEMDLAKNILKRII